MLSPLGRHGQKIVVMAVASIVRPATAKQWPTCVLARDCPLSVISIRTVPSVATDVIVQFARATTISDLFGLMYSIAGTSCGPETPTHAPNKPERKALLEQNR